MELFLPTYQLYIPYMWKVALYVMICLKQYHNTMLVFDPFWFCFDTEIFPMQDKQSLYRSVEVAKPSNSPKTGA